MIEQVAKTMESERRVAEKNGGVEQALQKQITIEEQALIGALRCMYFLVHSKIPHTTNFASLMDLCKMMGCEYLNALKVKECTTYSS